MKIFPAIDLFGGQAVRLYKGDYDQMTVYDPEPLNTVRKFEAAGASNLHLVDLEGAKTGQTTNLPTIEKLAVLGDEPKFGTPVVEGASVDASVVKNGKGKKVVIFKYKPKKGYRLRQGHRQPYTKVEIKKINA